MGITRHRLSSKTEFLVPPPDPAFPSGHLIGDGGDSAVPLVQVVAEREVRLLTSQKSVKRPDGWKVCLILDADSQGGRPVRRPTVFPHPTCRQELL